MAQFLRIRMTGYFLVENIEGLREAENRAMTGPIYSVTERDPELLECAVSA